MHWVTCGGVGCERLLRTMRRGRWLLEVTKGMGIWIFAGCFASMMLCAGAWLLLMRLCMPYVAAWCLRRRALGELGAPKVLSGVAQLGRAVPTDHYAVTACVSKVLLAAKTQSRSFARWSADQAAFALVCFAVAVAVVLVVARAPRSWGPIPQRQGRQIQPAGRRAWMRDVFVRDMDVPYKNFCRPCAPVARSASGARTGCAFFWLLFFAQAKKSDSRPTGRESS